MTDRIEAAADSFRRLFESEEEAGLAVLDAEGRIRAASAVLERLCATGSAPGPGGDPALLFAPASQEAVRRIISVALAGPPVPPAIEARLAIPDQPADAAVEVHCRPLRGEAGALLRVLDITARRRRQAQLEEAARLAAGTALSGPAGGVAAGVALAERGLGQDLITFDVGGTSTDIALIQEGDAALGRGRDVAGERIALESLDIVTLGAGGGSIGHVGAGGTLQVGPRSAGAVPGPAAYGQGGTEPAVTDANLVLGYLDAANFLGGKRKLDMAAAEQVEMDLLERRHMVERLVGIQELLQMPQEMELQIQEAVAQEIPPVMVAQVALA